MGEVGRKVNREKYKRGTEPRGAKKDWGWHSNRKIQGSKNHGDHKLKFSNTLIEVIMFNTVGVWDPLHYEVSSSSFTALQVYWYQKAHQALHHSEQTDNGMIGFHKSCLWITPLFLYWIFPNSLFFSVLLWLNNSSEWSGRLQHMCILYKHFFYNSVLCDLKNVIHFQFSLITVNAQYYFVHFLDTDKSWWSHWLCKHLITRESSNQCSKFDDWRKSWLHNAPLIGVYSVCLMPHNM